MMVKHFWIACLELFCLRGLGGRDAWCAWNLEYCRGKLPLVPAKKPCSLCSHWKCSTRFFGVCRLCIGRKHGGHFLDTIFIRTYLWNLFLVWETGYLTGSDILFLESRRKQILSLTLLLRPPLHFKAHSLGLMPHMLYACRLMFVAQGWY